MHSSYELDNGHSHENFRFAASRRTCTCRSGRLRELGIDSASTCNNKNLLRNRELDSTETHIRYWVVLVQLALCTVGSLDSRVQALAARGPSDTRATNIHGSYLIDMLRTAREQSFQARL